MDDFSVFSSSFEECLHRLTLVLVRCKEKNLVLNWEKCHFMLRQGIVLGYVISQWGIEVDKAKVDMISNLPPLRTMKDVHSFLGHVGFYRRFIQDFYKIAKPLCKLLLKKTPFIFDKECKQAFGALKKIMMSTPVIQPPKWGAPFGMFNLFEHCISLKIPVFDSYVGLERLHMLDRFFTCTLALGSMGYEI